MKKPFLDPRKSAILGLVVALMSTAGLIGCREPVDPDSMTDSDDDSAAEPCNPPIHDSDGDGHENYSEYCSQSGDDFCDRDPNNWTHTGCDECRDLDDDGYGENCDRGADCDDRLADRFDTCDELKFVQVTASEIHSCALRANGQAVCWGGDVDGQVLDTPPDRFVEIASSWTVNCGIRMDATVTCWGGSSNGAANPPAMTFTQIDLDRFGDLGTGIHEDGSVVWWDEDDGDNVRFSDGADTTYKQIKTDGFYACGIQSDDSLSCGWLWPTDDAGMPEPPEGTFIQIDVTDRLACAIDTEHHISCWGDSGSVGDVEAALTTPRGTFSQLSVTANGRAFACAIRTDGTLACWGYDENVPDSPPEGTFTQVSAGSYHACAIRTDGTLACWGHTQHWNLTPPPQ